MKKLKMFSITLNPKHLSLIKKMDYLPVCLGNDNFSDELYQDKSFLNIFSKNPYYGEYTFHYWLWKNNKIEFNNQEWIGFCQYRKFWKKDHFESIEPSSFDELNSLVLKSVSSNFNNFDSILGDNFYVNQLRLSKFIKHNFGTIISNPSLLFNKHKRTIKFHFDMMHGKGNLDKAIEVLNQNDREDFRDFVNKEVSFNPHNMFICKNSKILYSYYESVFPWLFNCEKIFGFKNLKGFGLQRIYGFLAERFMSFWFKKYTKHTTLPILFKDLNEFL